jgi:hypothetical protein
MNRQDLGNLCVQGAETAGRLVGAALAPAAAAASAARRARVFHPTGILCRAQVSSVSGPPSCTELGERLAGSALVRLSAGLHKQESVAFDVLGCAIRFHRSAQLTVTPEPDDQDLLLVTSRSLWTLPLALLTTRLDDFFANDYHGMAPFDIKGFGCGHVRLRSVTRPFDGGGARRERLMRALGTGTFSLELRRCGLAQPYRPIAQLRLLEPVDLDQEALAFSPFQNGRGIRPRGFTHALRVATYAASQSARPRRARSGPERAASVRGRNGQPVTAIAGEAHAPAAGGAAGQ